MATSIVLPALPSGLGSTIIQANALSIPVGEYTQIDWYTAQRRVADMGKQYFPDFPMGKNPDTSWTFFTRTDMTGASAGQKTILGVQVRTIGANRSALNPTSMITANFPTTRKIVRVFMWHVVEFTLTNGAKYLDVQLSITGATVFVDPETGQLLTPTNGYQAVYEALSLLLKPVAAGAPLWDPAFASLAGLNPNV